MNIEIVSDDVAKEVLTILYNCDRNITDKVPTDIYQTLTNKAADSMLEIYMDPAKPLYEQDLSEDALDTFSAICYLYVADPSIQARLLREWIINDTKEDL